jgi:hypothetical protein
MRPAAQLAKARKVMQLDLDSNEVRLTTEKVLDDKM